MNESRQAHLHPVEMIDVNILPERYRRRKVSLVSSRPWLFALAYMLLLIPAVKLSSNGATWLREVEADLAGVQTALAEYRPLAEEKADLEARIAEARNQISQVEIASQSATIQTIVWSDVLRLITGQAPAGADLTILDQSETGVVIVGVTDDHRLALRYADELSGMGVFSSVTVESLVKISPPEPEAGDEAAEQVPSQQYEFEISLELFAETVLEGAE